MKQNALFVLASVLLILTARAAPKGIGVYAENPRYWQFDGRPILLLGGSTAPIPTLGAGNVAPPGLVNDEGMLLWPDALEALAKLERAGGNYVRCLMSGCVRGQPLWPFARKGDRYDLEQWDAEYWRRFESFLREARARHIVVQVELWATFDYAREPWAANPFNPKNNLNYTAEATGMPLADDVHPSQSKNRFFRTIPEADNVPVVLALQQRFVDRILEHTLRYDHVLYCIDNETRQSPAWGAYWARHVRTAATKAGRSVCITEMFGSHDLRQPIHAPVIDHPEIYDFVETAQNNHQLGQLHYDILQVVRNRTRAAPRPLNNVKIYGVDDGRFGTSRDAMERFWRNIFAGCASARFHEKHLGGTEPAARMIAGARAVTAAFDVFRASPRNDLLSEREPNEAYCLADPPRAFAVYFPDEGNVRLALGEVRGGFMLRWYSIDNGRWGEPTTLVNGRSANLQAPDKGQWVAVVRSAKGERP